MYKQEDTKRLTVVYKPCIFLTHSRPILVYNKILRKKAIISLNISNRLVLNTGTVCYELQYILSR